MVRAPFAPNSVVVFLTPLLTAHCSLLTAHCCVCRSFLVKLGPIYVLLSTSLSLSTDENIEVLWRFAFLFLPIPSLLLLSLLCRPAR